MAETLTKIGHGPNNKSKLNPVIAGRKMTESMFRIFDDDKDGNIQSSELASMFSSWIGTIMNLIVETLDIVEDLLFDDAVKTAAFQAGMGLEMFPKDGDGNINIDQALQTILQNVPDQASSMIASQVTSTTEQAKQMTQTFVPDIDERFKTTTRLYDGLMARLDSMAVNGELSKEVAVESMAPVCCDIIENFLSLEVVSKAKAQPMESLNQMTEGMPFQARPNLADDLANTVVISLRTFFRSGGLKKFLETFVDLLDVNGDGKLSKEEIKNLADASSLLFTVTSSFPALSVVCGARRVACALMRRFMLLSRVNAVSSVTRLSVQALSSRATPYRHHVRTLTSLRSTEGLKFHCAPRRAGRSGRRRGCATASRRRQRRTWPSWTPTRTASSARPSSGPLCARWCASRWRWRTRRCWQ
jgi:hypothetical protein